MDKLEYIEEFIMSVEGGYINSEKDSGGETNFGITIKTAVEHRHLWGKYNWDGNMLEMPRDFALEVYSQVYWDGLSLDTVLDIAPATAIKLLDIGVNCGVTVAQSWLQRILNVNNNIGSLYPDLVVDGNIGPRTLGALNSFIAHRGLESDTVLLMALTSLQGHHYITLAERREKDETWVYGWFNKRIVEVMTYFF